MDIKVPHLAEGVNSGTVVNIFVKPGDRVKKNQDVMELETKKAVAAIPSPVEGVVFKILCKEGDEVNVGQIVISLSQNGTASSTTTTAPAPKTEVKPVPAAAPVQYSQPAVTGPSSNVSGEYRYESRSGFAPPASPSVRKMAQELGIDLTRVRGSEDGGRIVIEDVRAYIQYLQEAALNPRAAVAPAAPQIPAKPAPVSVDFSKWGSVRKQKMSQLRRAISEQMVASWTTIPHVTQFDEADVTALMSLREKYASIYEKQEVKLTLTGFILKALTQSLKKYPIFNSSMDEATNEIVYKDYIHIGIAVATEQGLIVPVIRNVDKKGLVEISKDLSVLAKKTRERKVGLDELQGGTFTLSNQGSIGGTFFTPIVNKPEVAILGVGKTMLRPLLKGSKVENRMILPLGLSYDHRVIDGADAARFIQDFVQTLENFNESDVKLSGTSVPENKNSKDARKIKK